VLHPGKTGGTYLKSVVRHNKKNWSRRIKLLSHRETVASTQTAFGADRQLAFTFREPMQRFVSGFNSRLRQGRPTNNRVWSPGEAAAFLFFDTANQLAESLDSPDERMKSAAFFAFNSIMHLKKNYEFYFESPEALTRARSSIVACIDVQDLDRGIAGFFAKIGIGDFDLPPGTDRHASPARAEELSARAKRNLKSHWAQEFEFFEAFKEIERTL